MLQSQAMEIIPVILGGGIGSRLWPLSRSAYPKQYNAFLSNQSLFQDTLIRTRHFSDQVLVVAGEDHRFLILEQSAHVGIQPTIILEPARRDTAAAIALAAAYLESGDDPLMLVMPADHVIENKEAFFAAVERASSFANAGQLITFGCHPDYPSNAYGYIKQGAQQSEGVFSVEAFVEKPTVEKAESYIATGNYNWNSGIFLFHASVFLTELARFEPKIQACSLNAMKHSKSDGAFVRPEIKAFNESPKKSIDYAVMEKTNNVVVVPVTMGWSDVGSWRSLHDHLPKDNKGNTFSGDVLADDVNDTYIRSTNRLVMALGLKNLVVVETRDAVLVADKTQSEKIKECVEQLKAAERSETEVHSRVYRPWGFYETLEHDGRFQVKRISVKPGAQLSLQMHDHRSEHWVIFAGQGEVTCGENTFLIGRDQSTYIPKKTKHRLKNVSDVDLEIIEVQVGDYLGEDDIHRFEDDYGRITEHASSDKAEDAAKRNFIAAE